MSDVPELPGLPSRKPELTNILEEDQENESTATGTTVIAKFTAIDRILDSHDPSQSQSCAQHELPHEEIESEEEYFSYDKLLRDNPYLSSPPTIQVKASSTRVREPVETTSKSYSVAEGVFSPQRLSKRKVTYLPVSSHVSDRILDLHDPSGYHPCPQHERPLDTIESDEECFSYDKMLQDYPNPSSEDTIQDRILDSHDPSQSQSCAQHELPREEIESEEEYFSYDKLLRDNPYLYSPPTIQVKAYSTRVRKPVEPTSKSYSLAEGSFSPQRLSKRKVTYLPASSHVSVEDPEPAGLTRSPSAPLPSTIVTSTPIETRSGKRYSLAKGTISPRGSSKRMRRSPFSSYVSGNILSPIDTGLGDLDAKSALFLARHLKPTALQKPQPQTADHSKGGQFLVSMSEALRENATLVEELKKDAKSIGLKMGNEPCPCDVRRHPPGWSFDRIQDVHDYSFLLNCQGLALNKDIMIATNIAENIIVYDVPMNSNNAVKTKAEQVLRFIDVEIGFGDQTCNNLYHYVQPHHRKILLVVSRRHRVVAILVAERINSAHRLLRETSSYMVLEERPVPVRIGINRLWVHISMRRKHLATILCRLVGRCFYKEETLNDEDYAFNNVSDAMVMFAKIYLKSLRPPLYYKY